MYHLNFLVLLLRPFFPARTRLLVRQNGSIASTLAASRAPWLIRLLYRRLYPHANRILCQTSAMAEELARLAPRTAPLLTVLPNPIDAVAICAAGAVNPAPWPGAGPHLLALGRLAPEKGFDLLLAAFAQLRLSRPSATLLIAGEGPERPQLEAQVTALGLASSVRLPGALADPWPLFASASLFVLSSRQDALPNALLEAAAAGLPLVATPASPGLLSLLKNQPGVWLAHASTAEALAEALQASLDGIEPGQRFPHAFVAPYLLENALPLWENLFTVVREERP
jgi:glycosyltransferase involved in cell wall biosynthesis